MFGLGGGEILVIVAVALLVFGPSKLPQIARTLKAAYQEFRKLNQQVSKTVNEIRQDIDLNLDLGLDDDAGKTGADARSAKTSRVIENPRPTEDVYVTEAAQPASGAASSHAPARLRAPEGGRVGLRPPEPPPARALDNPLPVAVADDYLAPVPVAEGGAAGADDYLGGGAA